jgi:AcrR family transcriptional regulator
MRADARRNRERIVGAALALFTERGPRVPMEDVASAAGVGVGTLYRHFPDRATLAEEIGVDALGDLVAFGRERLAEDGPRWEALRRVVEYCAGRPFALIKALAEDAGTGSPERLTLQREADAQLARIVEAAQQEGTLRQDITPREVVDLLSVVLCRPGARVDDPLTRVTLDGLRA